MKFAYLLGAALLCDPSEAVRGSAKIKNLIDKVLKESNSDSNTVSLVADIFDVAGFEQDSAVGKVGLNVCIENPKRIHMSKEAQQVKWNKISDPNSALDTGSWMPTPNGFRFKSEAGVQIHCAAAGGRVRVSKLLVQFGCNPLARKEEDLPRFAKLSTTFWQSCPDGHVPYGWQDQWGDFNFPYYAITVDGYLGCTMLTKDGYCIESESTPGSALNTPYGYNDSADSTPVSQFPFDSYKPEDLMPGSHYYTSAQPTPPKEGVSISPGTTSSEQPSEHAEEAAQAAPVSTSSEQPKQAPAPEKGAPAQKDEAPKDDEQQGTAAGAQVQLHLGGGDDAKDQSPPKDDSAQQPQDDEDDEDLRLKQREDPSDPSSDPAPKHDKAGDDTPQTSDDDSKPTNDDSKTPDDIDTTQSQTPTAPDPNEEEK